MSSNNIPTLGTGKLDYLQKYLGSSSSSSVSTGGPVRTVVDPLENEDDDNYGHRYSNSSHRSSAVTSLPNTVPVSSLPSSIGIPSRTYSVSPPRRKRRYDSDEDEKVADEDEKVATTTNDNKHNPSILHNLPSSSLSSSSIRTTSISTNTKETGNNEDIDVPRRRKRYDSDEEEGEEKTKDTTISPPRRPAKSTLSVPHSTTQSSFSSSQIPPELRKTMETAGINVDKVSQTVYRDKDGRKINIVDELRQQQQQYHQNQSDKQQQRYEWSTGTVQKQQIQQEKEELMTMEKVPFARTKDDQMMNAILRNRSRNDDPMKHLVEGDNNNRTRNGTNIPHKPRYMGPDPPPNRYNIPPGYRWDGVDRGNGWEMKVLATRTAKKVQQQKKHLWSVSDM